MAPGTERGAFPAGDGKKHPGQDYNVQQSLDPDIKTKHKESVKGRILWFVVRVAIVKRG